MDLKRTFSAKSLIFFGIVWTLLCWQMESGLCLTPTDLRVVEGNTPFDGVVEAQIAGVWERVCQMGWSYRMADHVCRHMGFSEGAMFHRSETTLDMRTSAIPTVSCSISAEGAVTCQRTQVSCSLTAGVTCNFPGYLGCFHHSRQNPINSGLRFINDSMTIEKCMEFCRMGRYKYAGLAFGKECLCDNRGPTYWPDRKTDNANCLLPCRGDRWEACGGVQQARIYETRLGVCGGKLTPSDRYISSPLFPSEYERGSICTWKVTRDDPSIGSFTLNFMMLFLLPGDLLRITDLETENWARPRSVLLLVNSDMTYIQGSSMNVSGAGFYVEFQSSLTTIGPGDPGFMITYHPNIVLPTTTKPPITQSPNITVPGAGMRGTDIFGHVGGFYTTYKPSDFPPFFGEDSMEESTTYSPTMTPFPTARAQGPPGRIVAAVATVGIGGGVAAFWGVSLAVVFLRKKIPKGVLKYYKGDYDYEDDDSTSGSDISRGSSVSSYGSRNSYFDSDTVSLTLSEKGTENTTPISGPKLIHTTNENLPTGGAITQQPRRTRYIKAKKATTRIMSTFVDHIYSSVYIPGRTVRGAKNGGIKKKKPTIAPKPDIVPMVDRKCEEDRNYDQPCISTTNSMAASGNVRFSIPLYQNVVKYKKDNKNCDGGQLTVSPVKQGDGEQVDGNILVPNKLKSKDSVGYLAPGKSIYGIQRPNGEQEV